MLAEDIKPHGDSLSCQSSSFFLANIEGCSSITGLSDRERVHEAGTRRIDALADPPS